MDSGENLSFRLALTGQLQDARLLSWKVDLCSCNNQVDPSGSRDLCGIIIDRLHSARNQTQNPTSVPYSSKSAQRQHSSTIDTKGKTTCLHCGNESNSWQETVESSCRKRTELLHDSNAFSRLCNVVNARAAMRRKRIQHAVQLISHGIHRNPV